MPASMAAWRTVRPFSTVTWRPSIVSVTDSISYRSYLTTSASRAPGERSPGGRASVLEIDQCDIPFADGRRPESPVQGLANFHDTVVDDNGDVGRAAVRVRERHHGWQVEDVL